jgi:membrane protein YdbS with pleckstrin-like domain
MNQITIARGEERLGPYTMDQARNLVLSGKMLATERASIDGGQTWLPLHSIPGFADLSTSHGLANPNAVLPPLAEETLWEGTPSQAQNLGAYIGWIVVMALVGVVSYYQPEALKAYYGAVPLCAIHLAWVTLRVWSTHYTFTNQRVRVTKGLLSKNVQEIELYRVKDTSATQTLFQRLLRLGNIEILSGDAENPDITVYYIPRAMEIREQIRHDVLYLRQRLNVRELDMM